MVVVVDDDEATRQSLRFLLECEGIEVLDFGSGEQLLASEWSPAIGCVILDINMPGVNGLDVLTQLRRTRKELPVIIVTGQPNGSHRARALAAGALAFIEKPVNDGRLIELVSRALMDSDNGIKQ
jgi:FixJ family two-component response regulator